MVAKVLKLVEHTYKTEDAIFSELAYGGQTLEQLVKKLKLPESDILPKLMKLKDEGGIKISKYYCNRPNGTEDTLTYYELNK